MKKTRLSLRKVTLRTLTVEEARQVCGGATDACPATKATELFCARGPTDLGCVIETDGCITLKG
jgi:hypothetical protein